MGVSFGFAIASAALYPEKSIVMVVGDSAFGFSCMELETAARHKLPLKVVIINNNGIGIGTEEIEENATPKDIAVNHLLPSAKYEMIAEAFGGVGKSTDSYEELQGFMKEMFQDKRIWVINVRIDPYSMKKAQSFQWLSTAADTEEDTKT